MARRKKQAGEPTQVHRAWSQEEVKVLMELFEKEEPISKIAKELDREHHSVYNKLRAMGLTSKLKGRHWSKEDDTYLDKAWGVYKVKNIAKRLNRTEESIFRRAKELGLGRYVDGSGEIITPAELIEGMGISRMILDGWRKHGLKVQTISTEAKKRNIVCLGVYWKDLMEWLENNQNRWDSLKVKDYFFVEKPEWLINKFEQDRLNKDKVKVGSKWTSADKNKAKLMYMQGYTFEDISVYFKRSVISVKNIIYKSDIKVNRASKPWTYKETERIKQLSKIMTTQEIADELGRSYSAILNKQKRLGLKTSKVKEVHNINELEMV